MNAPNRSVPLPGILGEIADVAGEDAAIAVARARGGTQVYFPADPAGDHWLSKLIGHDAARRVCDRLTCGVGGLRLDVPLGPAGHAARMRAKVDQMLADGESERDIALATGYAIRGIRKRRKMLARREDDPQLPLFNRS